MGNYYLSHTAQQVDEAIGKVLDGSVNASTLNGKSESELSVLNSERLNDKAESELSVLSATKLNGKNESELSVLSAETANEAGHASTAETANEATHANSANTAENANKVGGNTVSTLMLKIYPVGSIYMSVNSTSPATLFGGTWEQIQDRFLLAAGSTYEAGATGGEAAHTLTVDEIPAHNHGLNFPFDKNTVRPVTSTVQDTYTAETAVTSGTYKYVSGSISFTSNSSSVPGYPVMTDSAGVGNTHNNMPPYLAVYVWERTA